MKKIRKNLVLGLCSVNQAKSKKDQYKVRIKTANEFVLVFWHWLLDGYKEKVACTFLLVSNDLKQ